MVVSNYVSGSNTSKFDDVIGVILNKEMWWKWIGETSINALNVDDKEK